MKDFDEIIKENDLIVNVKKEVKSYNPIKESIKRQIKFDKTSTMLGTLIISSYLFIIIVSFLLNVFNICDDCYPPFLKGFEMLVFIITGFFFGTRVVHQYFPLNNK